MGKTPREVGFLSKTQESVLIGTILGDGGLRFKGNECRLHVKHAAWQLPLVQYKHQIFGNFVSMKIREFSQNVFGKNYRFAEFVSKTYPEFTRFYKLFYKNGKKIVPANISKLLTDSLSLAVWFMDDGSAEYAGASLQTHCFSEIEVKRLQLCLERNFQLETTKRRNKGNWVIYIPKNSLERWKELVQNHILSLFDYKLKPYSVRKKT
ncbi:hypothetical protein HYW29_01555 [Candidatus Amesbacteria bacterium]|nr:hypothetical protein [Candidatus Amesbacteria bacterium]